MSDGRTIPVTWAETATGTAATVTATKAAVAGQVHYITGYTFSISANPASAGLLELRRGSTALDAIQIPAAAVAPITVNFPIPIRAGVNQAVSVTVPSLGGTGVVQLALRGYTVTV